MGNISKVFFNRYKEQAQVWANQKPFLSFAHKNDAKKDANDSRLNFSILRKVNCRL